MPSTSRAQQRMMQAIAHGAKPTSKHGPSRAVARDFVAADHKRGPAKMPTHVGQAILQGKSAKDV
jgi:hypothetical protein